MDKQEWPAATLLYPLPVVMVSCQRPGEKPNIITIAWAGTVCTKPPMLSISIHRDRFSHEIIRQSREFVVNLPSVELAKATDYCGVRSGRTEDKFAVLGLSPAPARKISTPVIAECPVNIECKLDRIISLGSHDMFIGRIETIQVASSLIDKSGRLDLLTTGLITYVHGHYHAIGKYLGHFGYSVRKKKKGQRGRRPGGPRKPRRN